MKGIQSLRDLSKLAEAQRVKEAEALRSGLAQVTGLRETQALKEIQALKQLEAQRLKEIQRTQIRTITRITPRITRVPKQPPRKITKIPPIILLPLPRFEAPDFRNPPEDPKKGFNVFIRRRGRVLRRNKVPLTRSSAFGLGFLLADESVARSGFVREAKESGKSVPALNAVTAIAFKFRKPKGKTKLARDSFVERSAFAIDSAGELQGITARGRAQAERNRAIRKVLRIPAKRKRKIKRRSKK